MAMLIVSKVEEFRVSHGDLMEQSEWGLVHGDIQHPSMVMTQGFLYYFCPSLDIFSWVMIVWQESKYGNPTDTEKYRSFWVLFETVLDLIIEHIGRTMPVEICDSQWCGWHNVISKVFLISASSWLLQASCGLYPCLWSHIYSHVSQAWTWIVGNWCGPLTWKSAKYSLIYSLQWFGVILIYIIAQFPSLAIPWACVRQMAFGPKISCEINMTDCLKSNLFLTVFF